MKINMKKLAAWMLALLLVFQMIPALAANQEASDGITLKTVSYRDQLEITSDAPAVIVGKSITLKVNEGYEKLVWTTSDETVATVENGVVTGVTPGTVKIKATEDNVSDSIILRVIVGTESATGEETETEKAADENTDIINEETSSKYIIIINTDKEKINYDGDEHAVGFTATELNNTEGFDPEKVIIDPAKVITVKDCGVYKANYSAADFSYDGSTNDVEFVVNEGWIQIKPAEITVTADNKEILAGDTPDYSVSIEGLKSEEDRDKILIDDYHVDSTTKAGEYDIIPEGKMQQGNYKITFKTGKLIVKARGTEYDLYNLADVNGTWYRLAKSKIQTEKELSKNLGKTLNIGDYVIDDYDFSDLTITINKKDYIYDCTENAEAIAAGARYYTASLKDVQGVKNKIGGMNGNTPRWLIPDEQRYTDDNATDSYHANYTIVLHENPIEQPLYNMLQVGNSNDYYRLKKTTIIARPIQEYKTGNTLNKDQYTAENYDFSNVTLKIGGITYEYSDHIKDGEFEYNPYFTVEPVRVIKQDRVNGNAAWFGNEDGWLDGSDYSSEGNETIGWHRDYKAALYEGNKETLTVELHSNVEDQEKVYSGTEIIMTGIRGGTYKGNVAITWEREDPNTGIRTIIEGANEMSYKFVINEENAKYRYHITLTPIE